MAAAFSESPDSPADLQPLGHHTPLGTTTMLGNSGFHLQCMQPLGARSLSVLDMSLFTEGWSDESAARYESEPDFGPPPQPATSASNGSLQRRVDNAVTPGPAIASLPIPKDAASEERANPILGAEQEQPDDRTLPGGLPPQVSPLMEAGSEIQLQAQALEPPKIATPLEETPQTQKLAPLEATEGDISGYDQVVQRHVEPPRDLDSESGEVRSQSQPQLQRSVEALDSTPLISNSQAVSPSSDSSIADLGNVSASKPKPTPATTEAASLQRQTVAAGDTPDSTTQTDFSNSTSIQPLSEQPALVIPSEPPQAIQLKPEAGSSLTPPILEPLADSTAGQPRAQEPVDRDEQRLQRSLQQNLDEQSLTPPQPDTIAENPSVNLQAPAAEATPSRQDSLATSASAPLTSDGLNLAKTGEAGINIQRATDSSATVSQPNEIRSQGISEAVVGSLFSTPSSPQPDEPHKPVLHAEPVQPPSQAFPNATQPLIQRATGEAESNSGHSDQPRQRAATGEGTPTPQPAIQRSLDEPESASSLIAPEPAEWIGSETVHQASESSLTSELGNSTERNSQQSAVDLGVSALETEAPIQRQEVTTSPQVTSSESESSPPTEPLIASQVSKAAVQRAVDGPTLPQHSSVTASADNSEPDHQANSIPQAPTEASNAASDVHWKAQAGPTLASQTPEAIAPQPKPTPPSVQRQTHAAEISISSSLAASAESSPQQSLKPEGIQQVSSKSTQAQNPSIPGQAVQQPSQAASSPDQSLTAQISQTVSRIFRSFVKPSPKATNVKTQPEQVIQPQDALQLKSSSTVASQPHSASDRSNPQLPPQSHSSQLNSTGDRSNPSTFVSDTPSIQAAAAERIHSTEPPAPDLSQAAQTHPSEAGYVISPNLSETTQLSAQPSESAKAIIDSHNSDTPDQQHLGPQIQREVNEVITPDDSETLTHQDLSQAQREIEPNQESQVVEQAIAPISDSFVSGVQSQSTSEQIQRSPIADTIGEYLDPYAADVDATPVSPSHLTSTEGGLHWTDSAQSAQSLNTLPEATLQPKEINPKERTVTDAGTSAVQRTIDQLDLQSDDFPNTQVQPTTEEFDIQSNQPLAAHPHEAPSSVTQLQPFVEPQIHHQIPEVLDSSTAESPSAPASQLPIDPSPGNVGDIKQTTPLSIAEDSVATDNHLDLQRQVDLSGVESPLASSSQLSTDTSTGDAEQPDQFTVKSSAASGEALHRQPESATSDSIAVVPDLILQRQSEDSDASVEISESIKNASSTEHQQLHEHPKTSSFSSAAVNTSESAPQVQQSLEDKVLRSPAEVQAIPQNQQLIDLSFSETLAPEVGDELTVQRSETSSSAVHKTSDFLQVDQNQQDISRNIQQPETSQLQRHYESATGSELESTTHSGVEKHTVDSKQPDSQSQILPTDLSQAPVNSPIQRQVTEATGQHTPEQAASSSYQPLDNPQAVVEEAAISELGALQPQSKEPIQRSVDTQEPSPSALSAIAQSSLLSDEAGSNKLQQAIAPHSTSESLGTQPRQSVDPAVIQHGSEPPLESTIQRSLDLQRQIENAPAELDSGSSNIESQLSQKLHQQSETSDKATDSLAETALYTQSAAGDVLQRSPSEADFLNRGVPQPLPENTLQRSPSEPESHISQHQIIQNPDTVQRSHTDVEPQNPKAPQERQFQHVTEETLQRSRSDVEAEEQKAQEPQNQQLSRQPLPEPPIASVPNIPAVQAASVIPDSLIQRSSSFTPPPAPPESSSDWMPSSSGAADPLNLETPSSSDSNLSPDSFNQSGSAGLTAVPHSSLAADLPEKLTDATKFTSQDIPTVQRSEAASREREIQHDPDHSTAQSEASFSEPNVELPFPKLADTEASPTLQKAASAAPEATAPASLDPSERLQNHLSHPAVQPESFEGGNAEVDLAAIASSSAPEIPSLANPPQPSTPPTVEPLLQRHPTSISADSAAASASEQPSQLPRVLQNLGVLQPLMTPRHSVLQRSKRQVQSAQLTSHPITSNPLYLQPQVASNDASSADLNEPDQYNYESLIQRSKPILPNPQSDRPSSLTPLSDSQSELLQLKRSASESPESPAASEPPESSESSDLPLQWSNLEDLISPKLQPLQSLKPPSAKPSQPMLQKKVSDRPAERGALKVETPRLSASTLQAKPTKTSLRQTPAHTTLIQAADDEPFIEISANHGQESHGSARHLEMLAQEIYSLLQQRLAIEQERHGFNYGSRRP